MKWILKCLVCDYKAKIEGKPEDENIINATCLPCGHQGAFTLEEIIDFPEFQKFKKIPRLSREIIITEKIDGTNGVIFIDENNNIFAGSRNRWLWGSIQDEIHNDNHGFAFWVKQNKEELLKLGEGYHYGEWWGKGIQRGYGLEEKRFSLFNVSKWIEKPGLTDYLTLEYLKDLKLRTKNNKLEYYPECCYVVPILYEGIFDTISINGILNELQVNGSYASPGFMQPEGIVIYHLAGKYYFKKTIFNDEKGKDEQKELREKYII